ncbi:MAG: hypothetical protein E7A19_01635 [Veillonella sp.]|jgi:hypothetical protein|uniref:hypothetical protein n=1 Tax=Veillonella sp. TaxID=1926307 RepID=UPI0029035A01|nr:hypothetical protein [Veillonella sp.]MDU1129551.1 hypothetical protein [Veillonella sp.]
MKDVVINTTEQNLTPAIEEGMGFFIISRSKLQICETPMELATALKELSDYEPIILIKGSLGTLHAEMARCDSINSIRALSSQEIYDDLPAQNKLVKVMPLMPPATPDWFRGIPDMITIDITEQTGESMFESNDSENNDR